MKTHLEDIVGGGWDQLLALMTIVATVSGCGIAVVVVWLRYRLQAFFVTKPDHIEFRKKLADEHVQNTERLKALEIRAETLATRESLNGVFLRQETLSAQLSVLQTSHATLQGQINGVSESNARVEHMMNLVLENLLQREKT